jgi:hypothetical protein
MWIRKPLFLRTFLRDRETSYSHSIIYERSKPLIRNGFDAPRQRFAVILTVNLSGTSIGAGLRAI